MTKLKKLGIKLLLTENNKLAAGEACCCEVCDCPYVFTIGGNTFTLIFSLSFYGTPWGDCEVCLTDAFGGVLYRYDDPCKYYGTFSLTSCIGGLLEVVVYFSLSNFPDCDCQNSGDYCDYTIKGWMISAGGGPSAEVTNVVAGDPC